MDAATVTTTTGEVRGTVDDGVHVFRGIPYGRAERFRAPEPPEVWDGVLDALAFPDRSPQLATPSALGGGDDATPMSEDCLGLNVWTPQTGSGTRPVMVWFHGGGFSSLSGSSPMYDGVRLCQRGDVVVVTLNHRLNLFGFCSLAELGGDRFADSGNAGMLDLVLALRWVRDNIARFGGDPGNVTVFGESGGGAKVSVLMGMPEAEGLFHRAIVQSGVHLHARTQEDATAHTVALMASLGLEPGQVDELVAAPVERLLEGLASVAADGVAFNPVADGVHLQGSPWRPEAPACSAHVPLIILSTRTETTLLAGGRDPSLFELDDERLPRKLRGWLGGADPEPVIAGFERLHPEATPSEIYWLVSSAMYSRVPGRIMADLKAEQGAAPVWVCEVHWDSPVQGGRWGSPHTIDIPLVFDNVTKVASFAKDGPEARELAASMSEAWIAFARTGDPNHAGIPRWPAHDPGAPATMLFDVPSRVEHDWRGAEHAVLSDVPLRDTNR